MRIELTQVTTGTVLHQVENRTRRLIDQAVTDFGLKPPDCVIEFSLKGRAAGQLKVHSNGDLVIRYNPILMDQNPADFISQTIPHEVSHLIAYLLHGAKIRPHGIEWRNLMAYFGAPARIHHNYSTDDCQNRRLERFSYVCDCSTHQLTSIRHRRIQRGTRYHCKQCGGLLAPSMPA